MELKCKEKLGYASKQISLILESSGGSVEDIESPELWIRKRGNEDNSEIIFSLLNENIGCDASLEPS